MDTRPGVVILGTGMAGLGAAHRLQAEGVRPVLYDRNTWVGGHTASHQVEGFVFDEGPHVSFTKDERIKALLAANVAGAYHQVEARITNYWQGHWIRHPAITNLHGLPSDFLVRLLGDFVNRPAPPPGGPRHYEDWLVASYGRTFAETFPMQYGLKYHTTTAHNMTTDWLGPRLYQAKLEEVLRGAVSGESPNVHYVQDYRYPDQHGFQSFIRPFAERSDVRLGHQAVAVDPMTRRVRFANGAEVAYERLISSVPLPELIPMIAGTPPDVLEAAEQLACTSVVLVNIGVDRPDISDASWIYFYDQEFPFSRISFPRTFSPGAVPDGASSVQCEVYFSKKYRPFAGSPDALIAPVEAGLRQAGLLREDDRILLRHALLVPWANIIFDLDRPAALATVHGYLDDIGIGYCGRYGDWGYLWTDEAFRSGERAAQQVLDQAGVQS